MKKIFTTLFAASIIIAAFGQAAAPINTNGGFESTAVGESTADGWYFSAGDGASITTLINSDKVFEGTNAVSIDVAAIGATTDWAIQIVNGTIVVEPYTTYRVSCVAMAESPGLKASIYVGQANDPWHTINGTNSITIPTDWKKYYLPTYSTDNTDLRVVYQLNSIGKYYFDDVQFTPTPVKAISSNKIGDTLFVEPCFAIKTFDSTAVNDFVVYRNGKIDTVASAARITSMKFAIVLNTKILPTDVMTVSYYGSKIIYSSNAPSDLKGTAFESFTDEAVINNAIKGYNTIKENKALKLEVYPNPASERLILLNSKDISSVEIYNVSGARLRSIGMNANHTINIANMTPGMYVLKANNINGTSSFTKFVKK